MTFGQACERYLIVKKSKSLHHDALYLERLKRAFGADTLLTEITAGPDQRLQGTAASGDGEARRRGRAPGACNHDTEKWPSADAT
jgi:hypothetical protein